MEWHISCQMSAKAYFVAFLRGARESGAAMWGMILRELLVLVVQHDPRVASRIEGELTGAGVRVAGPVAGLERAIARAEGQVVDAVLLDLYLPDSRGAPTVLRFLGRYPDLPVIATAPRRYEAEARRAVAEGARLYVLDEEIGRGLLALVLRGIAAGTATDPSYSKDDTARRMLHDLGNRLAVISGESEMLVGRVDPKDPLAGDIRELHDAIAESITVFRKYSASRRGTGAGPGK